MTTDSGEMIPAYILMGRPGSGKGTQAAKLAKRLKAAHISTGDLLRDNMTDEIREIMVAGALVPGLKVIGLLGAKLDRIQEDMLRPAFVLEGFPRSVRQADMLAGFFAARNVCIKKVFLLDVAAQTVRKRIMKRAKISGRPDDLDPESFAHRLATYESKTAPVAGHYVGKLGIQVVAVNGARDAESVSLDIINNLNYK